MFGFVEFGKPTNVGLSMPMSASSVNNCQFRYASSYLYNQVVIFLINFTSVMLISPLHIHLLNTHQLINLHHPSVLDNSSTPGSKLACFTNSTDTSHIAFSALLLERRIAVANSVHSSICLSVKRVDNNQTK